MRVARTSGRWEDPSALSALSAAVGRADNADKADNGLRAICTKRPGDLYNSVGESTELHLEPVIEDEIVFFASPSHPLAGRRRIQLKSLAKETWVVRERGSATRELLESRLVSSGAKIGRAITLESPEAVKAVVAGGFGFSFLSIHGLRDDIKRGRLKKLSVSGFRLKRPIYYVRHMEKHTSPVIEAFLSLAQATF